MSQGTTARPRNVFTPWEARSWFAVPSWIISLAIHAMVLVLLAFTLARPGAIGVAEEVDRVVHLYTKESHDSVQEVEIGDTQTDTNDGEQATVNSPEDFNPGDSPPVVPDVPKPAPALGPGPAIPEAGNPIASGSLVKPARRPPGGVSGRGGEDGVVTFLGSPAKGTRFVFVLDSSGSMTNHNAIGAAKNALRASLQKLESTQQFQIIFYNQRPHIMEVGGKSKLFWGNDTNRMLAGQFIRSIDPDSGTNHLDALLKALSLNPDVIFFLTDADEPFLSAKELDQIKRKNNGQCQIHTIEFGIGANLTDTNFIVKLARQNGGTYRYHDITRLKFDPISD